MRAERNRQIAILLGMGCSYALLRLYCYLYRTSCDHYATGPYNAWMMAKSMKKYAVEK